jgi:hypothetical protein
MKRRLSKELVEKITNLFEDHDPSSLSKNLRRILLDYLRIELRSSVPLFTEELLASIYDLFEILDLAAEETKGWQKQS